MAIKRGVAPFPIEFQQVGDAIKQHFDRTGLSLPPPDVRGIATNPDSLFFMSIGAHNPVFIGWAGVLSPTGTAIAQLALPNIALPPLTFYLQAMTVSFRSPTGVRSLSNVHPLRL